MTYTFGVPNFSLFMLFPMLIELVITMITHKLLHILSISVATPSLGPTANRNYGLARSSTEVEYRVVASLAAEFA